MTSHPQLAQVPAHRPDHYLPDFVGSQGNPGAATLGRSPFVVSVAEFVRTYGHTAKRQAILHGMLAYRGRLRRLGMQGVQWLDGSFVGDVEKREQREPNDLDIVTFYAAGKTQAELLAADPTLFDHGAVRVAHQLDAYPFDLRQTNPALLLQMASYWHGLWSRSKMDQIPVMKGFLALRLDPTDADDLEALKLLPPVAQARGGVAP